MKVYKCDSCGAMIENPYTAKMKEFYVGCTFEKGMALPEDAKQKVKVHLCEQCYRGLCTIADNVRGDKQ